MITKAVTEFRIKLLHGLKCRTLLLPFRHRTTWATTCITTCSRGHLCFSSGLGRQHWVTHTGGISVFNLAVLYLHHPLKAPNHDLHIRFDHRFTEPAEFLLILVVDNLAVLLLSNVVVLEEARHLEEGTQKCVALHTQL